MAKIVPGRRGLRGPAGPAGSGGGGGGEGVPTGGTSGQVLAKASAANFDTQWVTPSAGGGGGDVTADNITDATATGKDVIRATNASAARTAIGAAEAATTVTTSGNQTIGGTKTFSSAPVVPDDAFAIAKVNGLQEELDALQTQTAIFVDDIEDIPAGTPVDTLVVVRAGA